MTETITITDPITIAGPGVSMSGRIGPVTLTDRICEKSVDQRTKLYDRKCPGLYVSITRSAGVATFFASSYTDPDTGKQQAPAGWASSTRKPSPSRTPAAGSTG